MQPFEQNIDAFTPQEFEKHAKEFSKEYVYKNPFKFERRSD